MGMRETERRGPSGELQLSFVHWESSDDRWDEYEVFTLKAENNSLLLVESKSRGKVFETPDRNEVKRGISPDKLIELIKQHGEKI